ncbi:hypothetical protein [Okeania sp. KiyG1]|nr:hypothetical protein [Okeania sp. KiyG1]
MKYSFNVARSHFSYQLSVISYQLLVGANGHSPLQGFGYDDVVH